MAHHSVDSKIVTAVPGCRVEQTWSGCTAVLSVSGSIDMLTAHALFGAVEAALGEQPVGLIVDLTDVEFLASAGLSVLVAAGDAAGDAVRFAVVAHGAVTERPLRLTGLTEIIDVQPTLAEALRAMAE